MVALLPLTHILPELKEWLLVVERYHRRRQLHGQKLDLLVRSLEFLLKPLNRFLLLLYRF
jgi:hypothetical protein